MISGLSSSSSLIAMTSPERGELISEAALTDSTIAASSSASIY